MLITRLTKKRALTEHLLLGLLAHDAFVRMNRCTIAMMFVSLSEMGMYCDYTAHFSADLSLWLDSPMFWAP